MATYDSHDPVAARHRLVGDEPEPAMIPSAEAVPAQRSAAPARCGHQVAAELRRPTAEMRRLIPEVFRGFNELHDAALAPGALDARTKELIALAIAVSKQCDGCIAAHARAAARLGASEQEVAETLGIVILMDGGPATVYGPRALAAFREFAFGR
jgi:AhpD family alkylhydroperoxidase